MISSHASLDCLLRPRSVAIVGASDNPDKIGGRPIHYMRLHGYRGALYPINPQRAEVQGERAWPSLDALPEVPELVIVAVPGQKAVEAVYRCADLGVKAAIIIAAGFSETGEEGRAIQDGMTRRAAQAGLRLVGPNSQGLANFSNGTIASFSTMFIEVEPRDGPVAVISQSGGMAAMMYGLLRQRGIGVRHMHATGNEADVTVSGLACAVLEQDEDVRVVLLYLESLQDPGTLARAAALARERGVSLAVVKAGRSATGARAAGSHTGALASEDRVVDAFLTQHGILRAADPPELARFAELLLASPASAGRRVVVVSNSGASCVLAADAAEACGLEVAPLESATRERLAGCLADFASTENPVDITAALLTNSRLFGQALGVIGDDPNADMFLIDIPVAGRGYDVAAFAEDASRFARDSGKPVAVVAWQASVAAAFRAVGVPVFEDERQAACALAAVARAGEWERRWRQGAGAPPGAPIGLDVPAALEAHGGGPDGRGFLSEHQSLAILAGCGFPVVEYEMCGDLPAALAVGRRLGWPCVLKACSAQLPHKSEHGLVAVGLATEAALEAAWRRQEAVLAGLKVAADGWIVARQVGALREMALGMHFDPVFGPVVMVGAGGKYVEAVPDVAVLLPPFSREDVLGRLRSLRIWPLLRGVRGEPPADIEALAQAALRLGGLALAAGGRIQAIDINPVLLASEGGGAVAADALIEAAATEKDPAY
ncbi:acetate--CoA ligase family protein [Alcaligenaceae bacterium]|nr:acetate--CoA ligase family protein [Alcaligenaceae bacterium]